MGKPTLLPSKLVSQHSRSCTLKPGRCGLCHWHKEKDSWRKRLRNAKWLQVTLKGKVARVGCAACAAFDAGGPWANFDLKPTALKLHCLKRHEDSKGHKLAEQSFQHGTNSRVNLLAPPLSEFRDAWTKMQQGGSCRDGGVSSDKKTNIRWSISEAILDMNRRWLKTAEVIALLRDERKGRLLIRFRACLPDLRVVQGVLGLKPTEGFSESLANCTVEAIHDLCQPMLHPPRSCLDPELPAYDDSVEKRIRERTTILVTDAASAEQLASNVLRGKRPSALTGECEKELPHVKIVGRDIAHASTRLLKRPFQKHAELEAIMDEFISGKDSFCQKVQHSPLYTKWWNEILEKDGKGTEEGGTGASMAAAKHRFGSYAHPLSRVTKNMRCVLTLLHKIALLRDSSGRWASQILTHFSGYKAFLLSLCADAAATSMDFTRFCDDEQSDISLLNTKAQQFLLSTHALFLQEEAFTLPTFAKDLLDSCTRAPFSILIAGQAREVRVRDCDKRRAMNVMKEFWKEFAFHIGPYFT